MLSFQYKAAYKDGVWLADIMPQNESVGGKKYIMKCYIKDDEMISVRLHFSRYIIVYTILTNFSTNYLIMCKVYTDIGAKENSYTMAVHITLENLCTRTLQSSRGGHSRRVEKRRVYVHLAVEKGNKCLNILLLRVLFADYCQ